MYGTILNQTSNVSAQMERNRVIAILATNSLDFESMPSETNRLGATGTKSLCQRLAQSSRQGFNVPTDTWAENVGGQK